LNTETWKDLVEEKQLKAWIRAGTSYWNCINNWSFGQKIITVKWNTMSAKIYLRIAAVLILIHGVLHTFGHSGWKKAPDAAKHEVIAEMTGHSFPFMGVNRSMGDYFEGYGYACTLALLLIAFLLWVSSAETGSFNKKIIAGISVCLLLWSADEFIYFFPFAAIITLLAALLSLAALFKIKPV
jgi:hypothetical protein